MSGIPRDFASRREKHVHEDRWWCLFRSGRQHPPTARAWQSSVVTIQFTMPLELSIFSFCRSSLSPSWTRDLFVRHQRVEA